MTKIGPTTSGAGAIACSVGSVELLRQRMEIRIILGPEVGTKINAQNYAPWRYLHCLNEFQHILR